VIKTSVDKHFSTKEFLRYNRDTDEIEFTTELKEGEKIIRVHRVLIFEQGWFGSAGKLWFKLRPESPKNVIKDEEKKETYPESSDNRSKEKKD
jgi:hypothetical protein